MIQNISIRLIQRVAVGTLALFLFSSLALMSHHPFGAWLFLGVLGSAIGLALWEYYEMAVTRGYAPYVRTGFWTSVAYLIALFFSVHYHELEFLYVLVFLVSILAFFFLNYQKPEENLIANSAITFFGFVYVVISLSFLLLVTYYPFQEIEQDGRWWLIYAVLVTKMTDVGAYIFGKWQGKTPLAPQVSPKKSIEGALGGLAFALLTAFLMPAFHPMGLQLSFAQCLVFGVCLGTIGQVGDLIESLFKRDAGIKDSSSLPGLGGALDIFDSMILTIPLFYFIMRIMEV